MVSNEPNPILKDVRACLELAEKMRQAANDLEKTTVQYALACSHGMLAPAAKMLGIDRSTLKNWLRRQYVDLGEIARLMRERAGYKGGNPTLSHLEEDETI